MTTSNDSVKGPYRVPPAKFRFAKGASGNLKGRPPKARALVPTKFGDQPGIGFESRLKAIAVKEAYRLITVREGDRSERVPVIQAILRKVAVNAANGNTRAQRLYLDLVIGAETDPAPQPRSFSAQQSKARNTGQVSSPSMTVGVLIGLSLFRTLTTLSSTTKRERSKSTARL
jgi:hypothetical protein